MVMPQRWHNNNDNGRPNAIQIDHHLRNSTVHGADFLDAKVCGDQARAFVYDGCIDFLMGYKAVNDVESCRYTNVGLTVARWCPPNNGFYKINSDAVIDCGRLLVVVGLVIRDSEGLVLVASAQCVHVGYSPQVVETVALLLHNLNLAFEMGLRPVVVESNSLGIVQLVNAGVSCPSDIGLVLDEIQDRLERVDNGWVRHVSRKANNVAHTLANMGLGDVEDPFWLEEYPLCVDRFLLEDLPY
ncbi:hypothetical protein Ddye_016361 [Dipteronia dyeriana]|uniref:RNase H type-1 domain-containing protein n=1 Tax=Dipteronia dyeriana TaxID=168575 RepID=A0AAD9X078_9ROSI|nr:hypothetical protein Ddye_016361 [Dipteronia dyeriana]